MEIKAYKISKIIDYMRDLLEEDMLLCSLWIEGEISNFVNHSSGHMFFSLKDDEATLRCLIFKNNAEDLIFAPKNGDLVRVYGFVSLYKKTGELRFIGEFMDKAGRGKIVQDLEALKAKLMADSCFENNRSIPKYPQKIAIVTSPIGAAIADMLKIIRKQNPLIEVCIVPVLVQGEQAPADIAKGLEIANVHSGADVIIVGRGGGSVEDLWAFNSEEVVRAVHKSIIPVVSAVGHETDFSLCDLAADLRCATPTEAASIVSSELAEMLESIVRMANRLNLVAQDTVARGKNQLQRCKEGLNYSISKRTDIVKRELLQKADILEKISPTAVLRRGFAGVASDDGEVIKLGESLQSGQQVVLYFSDTTRKAKIL